MAKIFTIDNEIRQLINDAIDDLIEQLGKDCILVYPSVQVTCPNCKKDNIGKKSANIWLHGGPMPFNGGMCPMCGGEGTRAVEKTETIKMLCNWNPKEWFILPGNLRLPNGGVQTKTYIKHMPKLIKCSSMLLETPIDPYRHFRFKSASEPIDQGNIVQGKYVIMLWERIGG